MKPIVIIGLIALLGVIAIGLFTAPKIFPDKAVFCTQDAKQCLDGSYVSRVAPSCEFASCPGAGSTWSATTDVQSGIRFQYPAQLSTTYIHTIDWPPKATTTNKPFTCTQAGTENAPAGKTETRTIHGHTYCLTRESEGAAGSIYTQYAYAFPKNNNVVILTFSLRFVQCANYDDPQKTACDQERTTFDIDPLIDAIAATVQLPTVSSNGGSGISGTVFLGPTCPVMHIPPDPQCDDKPFQTDLVVVTPDGKEIAHFASHADGTFSVSLLPGTYSIQQPGTVRTFPRCTSDTITVTRGRYSNASVSCDSGIR